MQIPYFKDLVDENGEEWLQAIFDSLETDTYDFSAFAPVPDSVSQSIDEALQRDLEGIDIEEADLGATASDTAVVSDGNGDGVAAEAEASTTIKPSTTVKPSAADRSSTADRTGSGEQFATTAAFAKAPEAENAPAVSDTGSGPVRKFDNVRQVVTIEFYSSELIKRNLPLWLAYHYPEETYKADSDEAVVVGLNGLFNKLKLTGLDDKIYTSAGNSKGETVVRGGEGSDTLYLTEGGLKADLGGKSDFGKFGGTVRLNSVENVVGSSGNDTIIGDGNDNKLAGGAGDDRIDGGGGNDTITGGGGKNTLNGGDGDDTITGGNSDDVIDGGNGKDKIVGGTGADKIAGGAGDDAIDGGNGNDAIDGGSGKDTIIGGEGDDAIKGGAGDDIITAGLGNDKVQGDDGNDNIKGEAGDDTLDGGVGNDTISGGDGKDTITGGDGDDILSGDAGDDTIDGGAGKDTITGGDGNDVLKGGAGNDKIDGGAGDDKITGGAGADTLTGGAGKDIFLYTAKDDSGTLADTFDIITDFDVANDKVDLSALLANDVFDFIAADGGAFTRTGPEVRWDKTGSDTIIEIDINGDGTADMKIRLDDALDLTASNFNL